MKSNWMVMVLAFAAGHAGAGGVVLTSISSSAQPVGGQGYLLEAFAAVYLGATVLGKGKPHVLGTLLGVFFLYLVPRIQTHSPPRCGGLYWKCPSTE